MATKAKTTKKTKAFKCPRQQQDTRSFPSEYKRRVVALTLMMSGPEVGAFIAARKLSCSAASAQDWRRSFGKRGESAFAARGIARDVSPAEMSRLDDADTAQFAPPAPAATGPELAAVGYVVRLYKAHPVVGAEAALGMISGILGIGEES